MDILSYILIFIFGTIIGSFLNVVILRSYTGFTIKGRSRCFSCNTTLTWVDLIPVISYTCLKGKCRTCDSKISPQYPLVELSTGILFVLVFNLFLPTTAPGMFLVFTHLLIACLMVLIATYDIKHKIIPNAWVYSFILITFGLALMQGFNTDDFIWSSAENFSLIFSHGYSIPWLYIISGPVTALPCFLIWLLSKGRAMGFADSKLSLGMGFLLGMSQGISAFAVSVWVGAIIGIALVLYAKIQKRIGEKIGSLNIGIKNFTRKSEIPFAPYLILGMYITLLFNLDVFHLDFFVNYLSMSLLQ